MKVLSTTVLFSSLASTLGTTCSDLKSEIADLTQNYKDHMCCPKHGGFEGKEIFDNVNGTLGWSPFSKKDKAEYGLVEIQNANVEHELNYAKTGSTTPSALHGIFWMDQRARWTEGYFNTGFTPAIHSASDEILVAFGESYYNPKTKCINDLPVTTSGPLPPIGTRNGHWTYMDDNGEGGNTIWDNNMDSGLKGSFCFKQDGEGTNIGDIIELKMKIKVFGINIPIPHAFLKFEMVKTHFGFDRRTTFGPLTRHGLMRGMAQYILNFVCSSCSVRDEENQLMGAYHYPVYQIVDGNGIRQQPAYDAYLDFINTQTYGAKCTDKDDVQGDTCTACTKQDYVVGECQSTVQHPLNHGNGTQLIPRCIKNCY